MDGWSFRRPLRALSNRAVAWSRCCKATVTGRKKNSEISGICYLRQNGRQSKFHIQSLVAAYEASSQCTRRCWHLDARTPWTSLPKPCSRGRDLAAKYGWFSSLSSPPSPSSQMHKIQGSNHHEHRLVEHIGWETAYLLGGGG